MTFGTMVTEVKYRCGLENDAAYDASIKRSLNLGQQIVARRYQWPFLEREGTITTVASTETYYLTSDGTIAGVNDVMFLYLLRNTTSTRHLHFISLTDFFTRFPNPTATGSPFCYRLPGSAQTTIPPSAPEIPQIAFYPIPDAVYTIKFLYYRRLSDLSDDNDYPQLPIQFHELPIDYATSVHMAREGDNRAKAFRDAFEAGLRDMAGQLSSQPVDRFDVLQSIDESNGSGVVQFPSTFPRVW